jgi:DNA-binding CsgD family transcriptional regulator
MTEIEERIAINLRTLIDPALTQLKRSRPTATQRRWLVILETYLHQITSPLTTRLSANPYRLTRTELRVVEHVRQGQTARESAERLGISIRTLEAHRHHIRRKLNLVRQKANLRSYLQALK